MWQQLRTACVIGRACELTPAHCTLLSTTASDLTALTRCLTCMDTPSPDGFSCSQQARWGKCSSPWLVQGGFCELTCKRCCHTTTKTPIVRGKYDANLDPSGEI